MKLESGICGTQSVAVTEANTAKTLGSGTLDVFATPALVALAEKTCWQSVAPALEEGDGTVGTRLELDHTAPTPVGMTVTCRSQLVAVVPMLLPMIMPTAWCSPIMPLFTKPTTITVVAEEDWITAVTTRPIKRPFTGWSVRRLKIVCSLPPACRSSALPITSMPNKNMARPPSSAVMVKILIRKKSSQFSFC